MWRKLFSRLPTQENQPKFTIVVSGLPRSGTSMMMKMLAEGGIPVIKDEIRGADDDNPNGYYEFELVKQLSGGQHQWLANGNGKAVKIISALLEHLPEDHDYKIIFMERDIKEILASQKKMLLRRNEKSEIDDIAMQDQFEQHLAAVKFWLARQPNIEVLYAKYNAMLTNPDGYCAQIAAFLDIPVDVEKMRSIPNAQLYRNRGGSCS